MEGWNEHAMDLLMPNAMQKKDEDAMLTWEERLKPLNIFECKDFGRREGKEYAEAVTGPPEKIL